MTPHASKLHRHRTGHWLPTDHNKLRGWVDQVLGRSSSLQDRALEPVLQDFKDFIDNDGLVRMLASNMFLEVPITPPYNQDPTKFEPQIRCYDEMFRCLNVILSEGPQWYESSDTDAMGLIGFPVNAILDWPMGTPSGYQFFIHPGVNAHWKAVLERWQGFLASPDSVDVLNTETGWLSSDAITIFTEKGNDGVDKYTFAELFQCDPSAPYYGYTSWDDFFVRKFNSAVRPVAFPDGVSVPPSLGDIDPTSIIVNACESTPCFRKENVQLRDTFWLKSQPYSLTDMLNGVNTAWPFAGGTVYQAFLSALSYHRWHAPVSGTVTSIQHVAGTYYSENFYEGFANVVDGEARPDPNAPNNSQPYIAEVATRAIITIQADNPKIGLMAIVFVGMCEVSSCDFT